MTKSTLYSMTAFARAAGDGDWGSAVFELRSVNHRYLESSWRLPSELRDIEPALRATLANRLHRGKVDVQLRFIPGPGVDVDFTINKPLVIALASAQASVSTLINNEQPLLPGQVLSWPGVSELVMPDLTEAKAAILGLFEEAVSTLANNRAEEGAALHAVIHKKLAAMQPFLTGVSERQPIVLAQQREQLTQRLHAIIEKFDSDRLEQEMLISAQKMDIVEECDRLTMHLANINTLLTNGGAIGRRLDFYMQELNREANTIGSKANDAQVTQHVVEMKVLIEQMREQIQNIE